MTSDQLGDFPYTHHDQEFAEMRRLLADSNAAAGWPLNWTFARLDNWRYASWDRTDDEFRQLAHLWRDGGRLVGFTILEGPDDWLTLQVRPEARDGEPAMLDWAEAHFRGTRAELELLCADDDRRRMALLAARGYTDRGPAENTRAYDPTWPRDRVTLPPGYILSDLATFTDSAAYCQLERVAFNNDYIDLNWFRGKTAAPGYDPWLHVIVLSPEGAPVAVAHGWADEATGTAEIDPVATHPDHRRLGLAQAAIIEAFRRLAARGVGTTWISSGPEPNPSNLLYESLAPTHTWHYRRWARPL
jgi:ribosomal protein S18 acetylase RimI-like enzyme